MTNVCMYIIADGREESVHFDKITSRIQKLCYGLNMDFVEPVSVSFREMGNVLKLQSKNKLNVVQQSIILILLSDCYNFESYKWSVSRSIHCGAG